MFPEFALRILTYFFFLLLLLVLAKIFLVIYRIRSGKWPLSTSFLLDIVEWDKEALKVGFLLLVSLLIGVVAEKIG